MFGAGVDRLRDRWSRWQASDSGKAWECVEGGDYYDGGNNSGCGYRDGGCRDFPMDFIENLR